MVLYYLFVIGVAAFSIVYGYRRGFIKQISSVLAVFFGIVCTRAFADIPAQWIEHQLGWFTDSFNTVFIIKTLAVTIVYTFTYAIVRLLTFLIMKLVRILPGGIINAIVGSLFCLFKYLMFVSLLYNLIVDFNPRNPMLKAATSHDGNIIESVMALAPAILDFPGGEDVAHALQLEDAKSIS